MTVLAIDIGGTKTAIAHVDTSKNTLVRMENIPTPPDAGEPFFQHLLTLAEKNLTGVAVIGISICELVSPLGDIVSGHRVDWKSLPVMRAFGKLAPCRVEVDVRCAALAEARMGSGRNRGSFFYLNLGTGISSTLVINGKPWTGARGGALVFANGTTRVSNRDGDSISLVLEDIAGGAGIAGEYAHATSGVRLSADAILQAAMAGDAMARRVVQRAMDAIGNALGQAVNMLDPEAIILGGGLSLSPFFCAGIEAAMRDAVWAESARRIAFGVSELGADAPLLGAAFAAEEAMRGGSV